MFRVLDNEDIAVEGVSLHHRNHPVCKVLGEGTVHIGKEKGHVENDKVRHLGDRCPVTVIQLVERLHKRHSHMSSCCIAQQFFGHYLHRRRHVDTRVVNLRKLAEQLFCTILRPEIMHTYLDEVGSKEGDTLTEVSHSSIYSNWKT